MSHTSLYPKPSITGFNASVIATVVFGFTTKRRRGVGEALVVGVDSVAMLKFDLVR